MTIFNILVPEEYKVKKTGEEKTWFHRVGTMFPHKDGKGYTAVIPDGISLSGRVMFRERTAKDANAELSDDDKAALSQQLNADYQSQ